MDCFLAVSLGRPNSISTVSASDLRPSPATGGFSSKIASDKSELLYSLDASIIIGDILALVYNKRQASRSIAYVLSLRLSDWLKKLPEELHWERISDPNQGQDITLKQLHINLIYFHGILLLTRPFLLHQICKQLDGTLGDASSSGCDRTALAPDMRRPEQDFCFHGACVRSAMHTISGVYAAYSISALPRRDPFVV